MSLDRCKHPTATPKTDGATGATTKITSWCSSCGSALINGVWTHPQMGKSGKKCHPDHGDYLLPTLEQYVAAGYDAANYESRMRREQEPIPRDPKP